MKTIVEYINESLRVDEAKKVNKNEFLRCLDKIERWTCDKSLMDLEAEYMSAGDAEDLKPGHWDAEIEIVEFVCYFLRLFAEVEESLYIDLNELNEWISKKIAEAKWDDLKETDPECDWDEDGIINLFNTVSQKVCKTIWLID